MKPAHVTVASPYRAVLGENFILHRPLTATHLCLKYLQLSSHYNLILSLFTFTQLIRLP